MKEKFIMNDLGFMLFLLMAFLMMPSNDAIFNLVIYTDVSTSILSMIGIVLFVATTRLCNNLGDIVEQEVSC